MRLRRSLCMRTFRTKGKRPSTIFKLLLSSELCGKTADGLTLRRAEVANWVLEYQQSGEISSANLAKNLSIVHVGTREAKTGTGLDRSLSAYYSI